MHIHTSDQATANLGFGNNTCNWGTHLCGLYETEEERDRIIAGFLHQGACESDLQFYCPCERTEQNFKELFQSKYPAESSHLSDPESFQFYSAKELYYPEGSFSPRTMDQGLNQFYQASQSKGPRNIRATAEMVWALEAIPGIEHLMVYESRLNYFIPGKPWISICLYNLNKFSGSMIMKVLQTHPFSITNGVIMSNPYYQNPDQWLSENAPEYVGK